MCGICGFAYKVPSTDIHNDNLILRRMTDRISHRGPDAEGVRVFSEQVFLGHRRLSIIDLSHSANQPLSNEDETVWIIYNGEIYNFLELRRDLESRGHIFQSTIKLYVWGS